MSKKIKAFVYQLVCFIVLFMICKILISEFIFILKGFWASITCFVIATLFAPKFMAMQTKEGEKLYMKWIFIKGVTEVN